MERTSHLLALRPPPISRPRVGAGGLQGSPTPRLLSHPQTLTDPAGESQLRPPRAGLLAGGSSPPSVPLPPGQTVSSEGSTAHP